MTLGRVAGALYVNLPAVKTGASSPGTSEFERFPMNGSLERSESETTDLTESSGSSEEEEESRGQSHEFASSDSSCSDQDCLDDDVLDALMELDEDDNFDVMNLL